MVSPYSELAGYPKPPGSFYPRRMKSLLASFRSALGEPCRLNVEEIQPLMNYFSGRAA
jgi:hypothetical protein